VTKINGTSTTNPEKLARTMRSLEVGNSIKLTLFREGESREVEYVLPERPLLPGDLPDEQAQMLSPSNVRDGKHPLAHLKGTK
jgi:hypothetical protein